MKSSAFRPVSERQRRFTVLNAKLKQAQRVYHKLRVRRIALTDAARLAETHQESRGLYARASEVREAERQVRRGILQYKAAVDKLRLGLTLDPPESTPRRRAGRPPA